MRNFGESLPSFKQRYSKMSFRYVVKTKYAFEYEILAIIGH